MRRTISINDLTSTSNQVFSCGKQRSAHLVDVHVLDTLLQVWDGNELIETVPRTTKEYVGKSEQNRTESGLNERKCQAKPDTI